MAKHLTLLGSHQYFAYSSACLSNNFFKRLLYRWKRIQTSSRWWSKWKRCSPMSAPFVLTRLDTAQMWNPAYERRCSTVSLIKDRLSKNVYTYLDGVKWCNLTKMATVALILIGSRTVRKSKQRSSTAWDKLAAKATTTTTTTTTTNKWYFTGHGECTNM